MQHTPGPWRIFGTWPTYFLQSQNITDRANLWADICTLNMANGCGMTDARLISAPPDLLAALDYIARRLQMNIDDGSLPDQWSMEDMVRHARAAISNATELPEG